jgi:hypothetical protein
VYRLSRKAADETHSDDAVAAGYRLQHAATRTTIDPHPEGLWPDSRKYLAADLGTADERVRCKIICENAGKLYGLL